MTLSLAFFLLVSFQGLSNAVFFDPIQSKHSYISYDVPFWHWKAIHNQNPKCFEVSNSLYTFQIKTTLTLEFQNIKDCCKKDCYFGRVYNPHGEPQVWCTTCQQWFHMVCCKKQKDLKSMGDVETMIIRGACFGVAGTGCFLDPLHPTLKTLLQTGKYPKLICNRCGGNI